MNRRSSIDNLEVLPMDHSDTCLTPLMQTLA